MAPDNISRGDIETKTDKLKTIDLSALKNENAQEYKTSHDKVVSALLLKKEVAADAGINTTTGNIANNLRIKANEVQSTSADTDKAVELRSMADYIDMLEKYEKALKDLSDKHSEACKKQCTDTSDEWKKLLAEFEVKKTETKPSEPPKSAEPKPEAVKTPAPAPEKAETKPSTTTDAKEKVAEVKKKITADKVIFREIEGEEFMDNGTRLKKGTEVTIDPTRENDTMSKGKEKGINMIPVIVDGKKGYVAEKYLK